MNKKFSRKKAISEDKNVDEDESKNLLQYIHQKLNNSPALNGGFDKLLFKIDAIEKSQNQIVDKVDKIHEAIYHPDDGLFSRIATNKSAHIESILDIEKQVIELSTWKKNNTSVGELCEKETDALQLKLQKLENAIENLEKYQRISFTVVKWVAAAIGGGIITLIFRIAISSIKLLP